MLRVLLLCLSVVAAPAGASECGQVSIDKDLVQKLPGKTVEADGDRFIVGEVTDAKSWAQISKLFHDPRIKVDFATQKLIYGVPLTHMDDLRPRCMRGGLGFVYHPLTVDIAYAFTIGSVITVDKSVNAMHIDVLRAVDRFGA